MLTLEQAVTIQILHQQGQSIKAISRELGISRNTVRKYLRSQVTPKYQRTQSKGHCCKVSDEAAFCL
ncbi:helix-turn-helix domain-containing protein, partial [Klebsiella pneumoniae]